MLDRVKFWRTSLVLGADALNDAVGWLGTVVLVLGVAAGIAVPVVFQLSPLVIFLALLSVFTLVLLEGTYRAWNKTSELQESAANELEQRFSALRYSIHIIEIDPTFFFKQNSMDVQIELKLKNTSNEYIRYEVESVSTVIEGVTTIGGAAPAGGTVIPPQGTDTFAPPAVVDVPLAWRTGSLSLILRYGDVSGAPRYRARWVYVVQGRQKVESPSQTGQVVMSLSEPQEVTDIKVDSGPSLAAGSHDSVASSGAEGGPLNRGRICS